MLIHKISIENVRSFLKRQEILLEGPISIITGPNGGGKTNLLDTIVTMLRRYLIATRYEQQVHISEGVYKYRLDENNSLYSLNFEKHHLGQNKAQSVEIIVKVSQSDVDNMTIIKSESHVFSKRYLDRYTEDPWHNTAGWNLEEINAGDLFTYVWEDGVLKYPTEDLSRQFLEYLQIFEFDNSIRHNLGYSELQLPMIYLPVHRAGGGFQSSVALSSYNDFEQKKSADAISSRGGQNLINLAVGRLGRKFRALLEADNLNARAVFDNDPNIKSLTAALKDIGYNWKLVSTDIYTNTYNIELEKQGVLFAVEAASSGERELLTYLFAIYVLNVRDAVIVVDEPELHLHPRWQKNLFNLFEKLAAETGNQFILATHSPTFITPASIQYVSRVFSEDQCSKVVRLNSSTLPNAKHLFNLVNSQNNERLFFADQVILVEGLSDRIFFEKVFSNFLKQIPNSNVAFEIISIGGKGLFPPYKQLLSACHVKMNMIADLDYIEQIGNAAIKKFFVLNDDEIKKDVIDNVGSLDGASLVQRIEEAVKTGSWDDANETWQYIKSRRRKLTPNLNDNQKIELNNFLQLKIDEGVFVLKEGALESYLPEGYRSKDIEKLISFLELPNFWDFLPLPNRNEIEMISKKILMID